mgnify:CR=1 FL=1
MNPLPPHLQALHHALAAEERAEADELARLSRGSLADRVEAGVSWPRLRVDGRHPAGRRVELDLRAPRGTVLHEGLSAGDAVDVVVNGEAVPGFLQGVDARVAEVAVDRRGSVPDLGDQVEVRRRADPSTWIRYRQALERGADSRHRLARLLLQQPEAYEPASSDRATGDPGDPSLLEGLDEAQRHAASMALQAEALAAIHGPPGTGKTRVLATLARALVAQGERPWALADSNAAVDHLATSCAEMGLAVVRLGHPARISDAAQALSMAAHLERSPLAAALTALAKERDRCDDHRERRRLAEAWRALRRDAEDHVLAGAEVIASTFGTLVRRAEHLPPAHTALVDEATQATEPAVWAAIPYVQRLVLAGDPEQLGPVCRVPGPLETSLLERVLLEDRVVAPMLEVQHRMDAGIRSLVGPVYGDRYRDHPAAADQGLAGAGSPFAATELTARRALWIDTAGAGLSEVTDPVSRSLRNAGEVAVVRAVVEQLTDAGLDPADIAVIAPYSAQVAALSSALPGVSVATVNAYQGRERSVVVASFVRSNDRGELGFVADGRRLTVTLTRARRLLVLVGDSATLGAHPRFAAVLDALAERGDLQSVFEPPWDEVL